jgi:hypothetical protein
MGIKFDNSQSIKVNPELKGANPKRAGAAKRFSLYATSKTVGDYCAAVVAAKLGDETKAQRDLAWDSKEPRLWIAIGAPVAAKK